MLHPQGVHPDDLLAHARFIRSLACSLVADPAEAEDVAQETMLVALSRRPREKGALRAWLAAVTRNLAWKGRLKNKRRLEREQWGSQEEALPPTEDEPAREKHLKAVVDAVFSLQDPYRTVVLLRFYEGLPPREIAKRLRVPVETVRSQVYRALQQMRECLDRSFGGDRNAWCLGLMSLAGLKTLPSGAAPVAAVTSGAGALVMSMKLKAGLAALLLAGVAVSLWTILPSPQEGLEPRVSVSDRKEQPREIGLGSELASPKEEPSSPERGSQSSESLPERTALLSDPSAVPHGTLEVEILDSRKQAVSDARAVIFRGEEVLGAYQTDERGLASVKAGSGLAEVAVAGPYFPPHRTTLGLEPGRKVIALPALAEVSGIVLIDGQIPQEPISLILSSTGQPFSWRQNLPQKVWEELHFLKRDPEGDLDRLSLKTDAAGAFRFEGLSADYRGSLEVSREFSPGKVPEVRYLFLSRPETGIVLDLGRFPEVSGRVLLPQGRAIVANARGRCEVGYTFKLDKGTSSTSTGLSFSTDSEGRFRFFLPYSNPTSVEIEVSDPNQTGRRSVFLNSYELSPVNDLGDLELIFPQNLIVQVFDPDGAPIRRAVAVARGDQLRQSGPTDERGRTELQIPDGLKEIRVAALGYFLQRIAGPFDGSRILEVFLQRANLVEVEVKTLPGVSREGVKVLLQYKGKENLFQGADGAGPDKAQTLAGASNNQEGRSTTSKTDGTTKLEASLTFAPDSDGKVVLSGLTPGVPFTLKLQDSLEAVIEEEEVLGVGAAERVSIPFLLKEPLRVLRGVVRDSSGIPVVGAQVRLKAAGQDDKGMWTGPDGGFRFSGLSLRQLQLRVEKEGYRPLEQEGFTVPEDGKPVTLILEAR